MKLLFDENLSPRLVSLLADLYHGSTHIHLLGMDQASDATIWDFAAQHGWTIVSKDVDFQQRSILLGIPPKVIGIRLGNSSVADTEALLRGSYVAIRRFHEDADAAFLAVPVKLI